MAKPATGRSSDYGAGGTTKKTAAPQPTRRATYAPTMRSLRKSGRPR